MIGPRKICIVSLFFSLHYSKRRNALPDRNAAHMCALHAGACHKYHILGLISCSFLPHFCIFSLLVVFCVYLRSAYETDSGNALIAFWNNINLTAGHYIHNTEKCKTPYTRFTMVNGRKNEQINNRHGLKKKLKQSHVQQANTQPNGPFLWASRHRMWIWVQLLMIFNREKAPFTGYCY